MPVKQKLLGRCSQGFALATWFERIAMLEAKVEKRNFLFKERIDCKLGYLCRVRLFHGDRDLTSTNPCSPLVLWFEPRSSS